MILTIAQHEWHKLFKTGKLWKLLALCQFFLGLIFYWLMAEFLQNTQQSFVSSNPSFGITEKVIHPLFAWTTLFFFFMTPLFATQAITHERKAHTLQLYLTSAISVRDIIFGKFLGLLAAQIFLLLPVLWMPLIIALHDHLDFGQYLSGMIGLILLLCSTLSLGLFIASFAKEPLMAAIMMFVSFILLSLLEWIPHFLDPNRSWIMELALLYHCKNFFSGIINSRDIIYYCVLSSLFLYLSILRLEREPSTQRRT